MSLLQQPVVLTTMEEDFRRIGLITEAEASPESDDLDEFEFDEDDDEIEEMAARERTIGKKSLPRGKGGKTGTGSPGKNRGTSAIDHGTTEDDEDDDDDDGEAFAEALAFAEEFAEEWKALGEEGIETVYFDDEGMRAIEAHAEEVVELPPGIVEMEDDDEEDPVFEDDEIEHDEIEEDEEDDVEPFQTVSDALNAIERLAKAEVATAEDAIPVFANIALIAETLYDSFVYHGSVTEDADYDEIAETFADMAKYSAAAVTVFREDDDFDLDKIHETLNDFLGTLMEGVEAHIMISEEDKEDDDLGEEEDDGGND